MGLKAHAPSGSSPAVTRRRRVRLHGDDEVRRGFAVSRRFAGKKAARDAIQEIAVLTLRSLAALDCCLGLRSKRR